MVNRNYAADVAVTSMLQGRTEALGVAIAALCIATPSVQARLEEMQGQAKSSGAGGGGGAFMLAADLPEGQRKVRAGRAD